MYNIFSSKSFIARYVKLILMLGLFLAGCSSSDRNPEGVLQVDDGFLQIPGVGWQTFGRTADNDPSMSGLPFKSGCAYVRWTWGDLEPTEGGYAFGMIDEWLRKCRAANQALAFRVMLSWPGHEGTIPKWLLDKGIKYTYSACPQEGEHYEVDLEEPVVKEYHEKLIRALGARYDGHPDLALVDIGSVGLWGEWHNYCDTALMPGDGTRKAIIDLYYESFPNTPLTALVDDKPNVLYANSKGRSAWRGDCWGNGEGPGVGWNHHDNSYKPMVALMPDGWKKGTVALEPCGTFGGYPTPPAEVADAAIAWHATFVQNKSQQIPANWLPDIERLVKKLGFRLVLRSVAFDKKAAAGSDLTIVMDWENTGIAPPYRDHRLAFRFRDANGTDHGSLITGMSVMGWLPGTKSTEIKFTIPRDMTTGIYDLELGVVFHSAMDHVIPIGNKGRLSDGWYSLGNINITGAI